MPPIALIWLLLLSAPFAPLAPGAHGPGVAALQAELTRLHEVPGPVDGQYGPQTEAAVARLERQAGLSQDGLAGAAVLGDIVAQVAGSAPLLQTGDRGAAVRDLQALLTADGFPVTADGAFGTATLAAVRSLQASRGLSQDGLVGSATWAAIFSRSHTVASGETIDGLAQTYGVPARSLLAANGGQSLIVVGQQLPLHYAPAAQAPASTAPAAATTSTAPPPAKPPTAAGSSAQGSQGATQGAGPSASVIPAGALAHWGGAGTPQLSVVVLAQDRASAQALRAGLPAGLTLALPSRLFAVAGGPGVLLATSRFADVARTGAQAVLWQGPLSAQVLQEFAGRRVAVLVARETTTGGLLAAASGGSILALPVHQADVPRLAGLARSLAHAGYRLVAPPE